jgi:2-oxoisovalerate dehydrogenase E1 component
MTLDAASGVFTQLDTDGLLALLRKMLTIRLCEEQLARSHQSGLVPGPCHTYVGEEAVAVGVCANLRPEDVIFSTHRGHGHALAKGVSPRELLAELFGKVTGCSHGRGGSMHLFAPEMGLLGSSGIVSPSMLMATGAAYSFHLQRLDRVAVAFFGDGASNNGAFHEALNMATIWSLPVLFVCENNLFATETPLRSVAGNADIAQRAIAYGLPGVALDGNDVLAVYETSGVAIRRARSGQGPTLLECRTYRTRAHAEGMRDAGYRLREEVEQWKGRCPIKRFRETLIASGQFNQADLAAVEASVKAEVEDAVRFAKSSPYPEPATAGDHVFSVAWSPASPSVVRGASDA